MLLLLLLLLAAETETGDFLLALGEVGCCLGGVGDEVPCYDGDDD